MALRLPHSSALVLLLLSFFFCLGQFLGLVRSVINDLGQPLNLS